MKVSIKTAFLSGDSFQFTKCIFYIRILAGFISYWMSIFPCQLNLKNPFLKSEMTDNSDFEQQLSMPAYTGKLKFNPNITLHIT